MAEDAANDSGRGMPQEQDHNHHPLTNATNSKRTNSDSKTRKIALDLRDPLWDTSHMSMTSLQIEATMSLVPLRESLQSISLGPFRMEESSRML